MMRRWERKVSSTGEYWEIEWLVGPRRHYSITVQKSVVAGQTHRYEFRIYHRGGWLDGGPTKTYADRYSAQRGGERYLTKKLKEQGLVKY